MKPNPKTSQQEGTEAQGAAMKTTAKKTAIAILVALVIVLGLVSAAAASAVWGG